MTSREDGQLRLELWVGRWESALGAAARDGTTHETAWGANRVVVGPPASADDLDLVARALPVPIPPGLREVLSIARSVKDQCLRASQTCSRP
jgi:hypothetical protein